MKINEFIPNSQIENLMNFNSKSILEDSNKANGTTSSFMSMLNEQLNEVNNKGLESEKLTTAAISGQDVMPHQVTMAAEEAKLSLEMAVQVRNKIVEAYQELNRMQM